MVFGIASVRRPPSAVGIAYGTPPTVYSNCFGTLQMLRSWSEDVHIVGA